jgi:outer membrane protein OmpA-like peptidoglycan-associated protein
MYYFCKLSKSVGNQLIPVAIALGLLLTSINASANTDNSPISDLLIVLDADGRSHTVQHTAATNSSALTIDLPGSVIPLEMMFLDTDSTQQSSSQRSGQIQNNASRLQLNSGSAFVRYQHQYGSEVEQTSNGHYVLTIPSTPSNIVSEDLQSIRSSIMWVFPSEFEILSYTITKPETGKWVSGNNTLSFHQSGSEVVDLSITYKRQNTLTKPAIDACNEFNEASDHCSGDEDADGVPDYRDICLQAHDGSSTEFGCAESPTTILTDIAFKRGRRYLDTKARKTLDRVAHALRNMSDTQFMIGAHTDNTGGQKINQTLSQSRADAVRHYLMLRGVGPNQVTSVGYGEQYPIRDNATQEGRMANRRVEISVIK